MTETTADSAAPQPDPSTGRSASAAAVSKSWGRAINGLGVTLGAVLIATLAFSRLLDQMQATAGGTSQVVVEDSVYALTFFYVAAGASVAIARGVVSIFSGPGGSRLLVGTPVAIAIVVITLWVVSAMIRPATPTFAFWVGIALPILGSIIEDVLVSKEKS
ncbi:hypothetical protein [Microbacterium enclense]|uniref:hypothetical protein n=1 Tax=Microbacterium enclense TaxID=993073 RepID=UPI0034182A15